VSTGNPNFDEYPHRVTLCFKSEDEKKFFIAGLSDGFGENICDLDWEWKNKISLYDSPLIVISEIFDYMTPEEQRLEFDRRMNRAKELEKI